MSSPKLVKWHFAPFNVSTLDYASKLPSLFIKSSAGNMTPDKVLVFMFGGNRSHNIIFICNCQFVACNEAQQIKSHRRDLFPSSLFFLIFCSLAYLCIRKQAVFPLSFHPPTNANDRQTRCHTSDSSQVSVAVAHS